MNPLTPKTNALRTSDDRSEEDWIELASELEGELSKWRGYFATANYPTPGKAHKAWQEAHARLAELTNSNRALSVELVNYRDRAVAPVQSYLDEIAGLRHIEKELRNACSRIKPLEAALLRSNDLLESCQGVDFMEADGLCSIIEQNRTALQSP